MGYRVGTLDTYTQLQKDYQLENQNQTVWENYLQGIQQQYQPQVQAVQRQAAYDISGAYANYKQQQLNLMANQRLFTGTKESLAEGLKSQYKSAYSAAKQTEASGLAKIYQSQVKDVAEAEEALTSNAKKLQELEDFIYTNANIDTALLETPKSAGGLEFYSMNPEKPGEYNITPYGTDFFQQQLLDNPNFTQNLYEENPELYNWYMSNSELAKQLIGGFSGMTRSEDDTYRTKAIDAEREFKRLYGDSYDTSKTFASEQERYDYYTNEIYKRKLVDTEYTLSSLQSSLGRSPGNSLQSEFKNKLTKDIFNLSGIEADVQTITPVAVHVQSPYNYSSRVVVYTRDLDDTQKATLKNMGIDVSKNTATIYLETGYKGFKRGYMSGSYHITFSDFFKELQK